MTWLLAVVLKPFAALVLFGLICLPARLAVQRWMPDGRLKRLLLTDLQSGRHAGRAKQHLR
jgi:hypothetical protein